MEGQKGERTSWSLVMEWDGKAVPGLVFVSVLHVVLPHVMGWGVLSPSSCLFQSSYFSREEGSSFKKLRAYSCCSFKWCKKALQCVMRLFLASMRMKKNKSFP